jgi:hypothetical protein
MRVKKCELRARSLREANLIAVTHVLTAHASELVTREQPPAGIYMSAPGTWERQVQSSAVTGGRAWAWARLPSWGPAPLQLKPVAVRGKNAP